LGKLLKEGIPYYGIKGYKYINLSEEIIKKKLYKKWDNKYDEPVIDKNMLVKALEPEMLERGGIILDFWTCKPFPDSWFGIVCHLHCNNELLYPRLEQRGWS
jgi:broad-specificity NMP kinase